VRQLCEASCAEVRNAHGILVSGAHRIEGEHVLLTEADREPIDDPFLSFREWWSEVDRRAFGDL
jgi:hypothetical protein